MGQYYSPINTTTYEWLYSHDYNSGLKLMEHSWIGNSFVGRIMKLLTKGNKWYKGKIVWAGDYTKEVYKNHNLNSMVYDKGDDTKIKLFSKIKPKSLLKEKEQKKAIIINHTKKEYVKISDCNIKDENSWIINPLPLLTALGNGGGGGDYFGRDMNFVGRWAFDEISVEFDENNLKDYTKINPQFAEDGEEGSNEENEITANEKIRKWLNSKEVKKRLILANLE